jgi:hypothetical protein
MIPCLWCGRAFAPRRSGGRTQRFCGTRCRRGFDAGLRAWTLAELAAGRLRVLDIRNASPATRALRMGRSGTIGDAQQHRRRLGAQTGRSGTFEAYAHARWTAPHG